MTTARLLTRNLTESFSSPWLPLAEFLRIQFRLRVKAGSNAVGVFSVKGSNDPDIASGLWADPRYSANQTDQTTVTSSFSRSGMELDDPARMTVATVLSGQTASLPRYVRLDYTWTSGDGALMVDVETVERGVDGVLGVSDATPPQGSTAIGQNSLVNAADFVAGALDSTNVMAAIEAAKAAAYELSDAYTTRDVYVPGGTYTLTGGPQIVFAPTGVGMPTPGFVGDGSTKTVFIVQGLADDEFFLTFGTEVVDASANYTYKQNVAGFSVQAAGGAQIGNGIRVPQSYYQQMRDIYVYGFQGETSSADGGIGISLAEVNHQHLRMTDVEVQGCLRGYAFKNITQGLLVQVNAFGNHWLNATFETCSMAWVSGNIQGSGALTANRWYTYASGQSVMLVSGFSYTTGLPSGTGATLSTQSGGLCTLNIAGLGAARELHRGRWIRLTDPSPLSPDKASGVYKIVAVSNTTVTIRKASNHTSRTVNWQICGHSGANYIVFDSSMYDESAKLADFGFYRDEIGASSYIVRDATLANASYAVDADGCDAVSVENVQGATLAIRARNVSRLFAPNVLADHIEADAATRAGMVCATNHGLVGLRGGIQDATGARSVSVREIAREIGAVEAWHVKRGVAKTGTDVTSWTGYINGTVLTPVNSGSKPQWVASDTGFSGPCIATVKGLAGAEAAFTGSIDAGDLPTQEYYTSLFAVVRLESTSVQDGQVGATGSPRVIQLSTAGYQTSLAFNDDWLRLSTGAYGHFWDQFNETKPLTWAVDTNPHAFAVSAPHGHGSSARLGQAVASDVEGDDYLIGATGTGNSNGHTLGASMEITIGKSLGTAVGALRVVFLAAFPFPLTRVEIHQLIDAARREWPLP